MPRRITQADILKIALEEHSKIIDELIEGIKMYSGKGNDRKPLVSPGFKIVHKKTGLNYTVKGLKKHDGEVALLVVKPSGEELTIKREDLKNYDRL